MALHKGDTIGTYEIIAPLGQGGMATVYKAYHGRLNRFVAIKMIHQAFSEDPSYLTRFEREAQIVAALEHPHIVPIYDFSEYEGEPYLVMKLIEGGTLKGLMSEGKLPIDDIINVTAPIGEALDYAHSRGVLHRDVKPSNIILEKKTLTPYLSDFGLARLSISGASTMSQDFMIGTPYYMSPEQAQGKVQLDARTDLYSFGVVLYELFVGKVPFSEGTPYAIINDHIARELPLPSTMNPEIPKTVELVLLRALAKDPDDRYQTAAEMMTAIRSTVKAEAPSMVALNEGRQSVVISLAKQPVTPAAPPMQANTPTSAASVTPPAATKQGKKTEPLKSEQAASAGQPKTAPKPQPKRQSHAVELVLLGVALVLILILVTFVVLKNNNNNPTTIVPTLAAAQPTVLITLAGQPTIAEPTTIPSPTQAPTLPGQGGQGGQGQNNGGQPPTPSGQGGQGGQGQNTGGQPPTLSGQGGQGGQRQANSGEPPLPPTMPVPPMSEAQAKDQIAHGVTNPGPYLALLKIQIQNNQDATALKTAAEGMQVAPDRLAYELTAANIAVQAGSYGDAFLFYAQALEDAQNQPPYAAIRATAGEFLYDAATLAGRLSVAEIAVLNTELASNTSPVVSAMIGRAFLSSNNMRLALTSINQALGEDSTLAEAHLVNGEYDLAQGDKEQARAEWQLALQDSDAPQWVTDRVNELLNANPQ